MTNDGCYTEIENSNPLYYDSREEDLKTTTLRFIHERCKYLRFDKEKKSIKKYNSNYVPYNLEKDVDRLCLENALSRFLKTGTSQDAFDVYVCYTEMFFDSYSSSRHVIEMLSEYEINGGSLLMKHRDHYSHSVYVFCIGLSFFESNAIFRKEYKKFYAGKGYFEDIMDKYPSIDEETAVAHNFLKYWGLTALFHDIGYVFELPYEEVCSYFESNRDKDRSKDQNTRVDHPYLAYHDIDLFTKMSKAQSDHLTELYGEKVEPEKQLFKTTEELFAYDLANKMGKTYRFTKDSLIRELNSKPTRPDLHGYYMDHAFFSANLLFRELFESIDLRNKENDEIGRKTEHILSLQHIDALTAILMHNSLFKFAISFYKEEEVAIPLSMDKHPLAYLLMLCDELQCWDRASYGRDSRTQIHPYDCELTFDDGGINATYLFDDDDRPFIDAYNKKYEEWEKKTNDPNNNEKLKKPKLKSYSEFVQRNGGCDFAKEIKTIVNMSAVPFSVSEQIKDRTNETMMYLSDSNFIHLYDFAAALNFQYDLSDSVKNNDDEYNSIVTKITSILARAQDSKDNEIDLYDAFEKRSLEIKLSNINQAKSFAHYLNLIGAFYTDKPLSLQVLDELTDKDLQTIGREEYCRWLKEMESMGWKYGEIRDEKNRVDEDYVKEADLKDGKIDDDTARSYYDALDSTEKKKETDPYNLLLKILPKLEGVHFYKIPTRKNG